MTCPRCRTINPEGRRSCHHCKFLFRQKPVENNENRPRADFRQQLTMSSPLPSTTNTSNPPSATVREFAKPQQQPIDDEPLEYEVHPTESSTYAPVQDRRSNTGKRILIGATIISVLAIAALAIYSQIESAEEQTATALFSQAEQLFEDGKFVAALNSYQDFLNRYPDNELVSIVEARISSLNTGLLDEEKRAIYHSERANILLKQAEQAFKDRQMVTPPGDNTVEYLNEILDFDHDNAEAIALRQEVIRHFKNEAQKSFAANHFKSARVYFGEILKLNPNDDYAQGGLLAVEKLLPSKDNQKQARRRTTQSERRRTSITASSEKATSRQRNNDSEKSAESLRRAALDQAKNDFSQAPAPATEKSPKVSIPFEAKRVRTTVWNSLMGSIHKTVKLYRHTKEMLILIDASDQHYVVLTQQANRNADIYRRIDRSGDGNPTETWVFGPRQLNSGVSAESRLSRFFSKAFIKSIKTP